MDSNIRRLSFYVLLMLTFLKEFEKKLKLLLKQIELLHKKSFHSSAVALSCSFSVRRMKIPARIDFLYRLSVAVILVITYYLPLFS